MKSYSISQLAEKSGVSVRTLHYYDEIGLLKPSSRSEKGYRIYHHQDQLKLQQILYFREMRLSLKEIRQIINNADFDILKSLELHQERIQVEKERLSKLLDTIEKTIKSIKQNRLDMKSEELYKGLDKSKVKALRNEAKSRWSDEFEQAENNIKSLGKKGWEDHQEQLDHTHKLLANMISLDPSDQRVQDAIEKHFKLMNLFYEVDENRYRGLAEMYVADERFKSYYENYGAGLAGFLKEAIFVFCDNGLKINP